MSNLKKIVVVAVPLLAFGTAVQADEFVRMVSGPSGGSWYPLGAKIMEVLGKEVSGISTSNGPGGGVGNVKDVSKKNAELGWSYGHTAFNGYKGQGAFDKAQPDVRHFATLYPSAFQTAVPRDSAIKTYADLKDKSISPGPSHFSGNAAARLVLEQYGLNYEMITKNGGTVHQVSYTDGKALMQDGHLDAFMALTSVPQASFIDLNFKPGIRLLTIETAIMDKLLKMNPGYVRYEIAKDIYKDQAGPTTTLGAVAVLVVSKELSEDLAYNLVKAMWDHHADFVKVKSVWNSVKLSQALDGAGIPVHPGVARYYTEKGVST